MDKTTFTGRILFVNKESYKNFIGHRASIKQLKYHCGNKNLTHCIQYDKDFFVITTSLEHERKLDDTTVHVLSEVHNSTNEENILQIINNHIKKVTQWKSEIGQMPNYPTKKVEAVETKSLKQKILGIFKKR